MNASLKKLVKTNFVVIAAWLAVGTGFSFIPATALAATSTVTVTVSDGGTVSPDYNGQQLVIGQTYKLQAKAKSGFDFTGWTGSSTASVEKISFVMESNLTFTASFIDVKKPKLTIKTPANKSTFNNDSVTVTGIAKDNSTIMEVLYQLNGTGWVAASTGNGWSNWWADISLALGTNIVQACAVDAAGNVSPTNKITLYYNVVPNSIDGQTLVISSNGAVDFTMSFTNSSFSQSAADTNFVDGVGVYTFTRINLTKGKLAVRYTAPPNATGDGGTVYLQYTNPTSGWFTNGNGTTSAFVFSPATNSVPGSLSGANFILNSTISETQRALSFITEPFIVDNGYLSSLANPLVIPVSSEYAGNIGDRVSVLFRHFNHSGSVTNNYVGTIIAATGDSAATNTVTVLFDNPSFVSKHKQFTPIASSLLNVVTYYYTNYVSGVMNSAGLGTFAYTKYSPAGALLQLTQTNENSFYILTFDHTGSSGTYYEEFIPNGGVSGSDAGTFGLVAPPQIITNPQDTTVTNGADATFNVSASGSAPLTFQWQTNNVDLADGGNISGSSTATLSLTSATTNDVASYLVIVGNAFGSVTSSIANLNITNSISGP